MYLSRLILDARNATARHWLSDCHALHQFVMSGFPPVATGTPARAALGVLFRVEQMTAPPAVPLLVQSQLAPAWAPPPGAVLRIDPPRPLDAWLNGMTAGSRYRFRLRANPVKRLGGKDDGDWRGKRVELRSEADQVTWLTRYAGRCGFRLMDVRLRPDDPALPDVVSWPVVRLQGRRRRPHGTAGEAPRVTLGAVLFEGVLEVADATALRQAIATGIGPGKAYGCGLLSLGPVRGAL